MFLDGVFTGVYKFLMPEWDVAITSMVTGMGTPIFYGPYGEKLAGPYYCEENVIER